VQVIAVSDTRREEKVHSQKYYTASLQFCCRSWQDNSLLREFQRYLGIFGLALYLRFKRWKVMAIFFGNSGPVTQYAVHLVRKQQLLNVMRKKRNKLDSEDKEFSLEKDGLGLAECIHQRWALRLDSSKAALSNPAEIESKWHYIPGHNDGLCTESQRIGLILAKLQWGFLNDFVPIREPHVV